MLHIYDIDQLDFTCISWYHEAEVFFTSQSALFNSARRTHQKEGEALSRQTFLDVRNAAQAGTVSAAGI